MRWGLIEPMSKGLASWQKPYGSCRQSVLPRSIGTATAGLATREPAE